MQPGFWWQRRLDAKKTGLAVEIEPEDSAQHSICILQCQPSRLSKLSHQAVLGPAPSTSWSNPCSIASVEMRDGKGMSRLLEPTGLPSPVVPLHREDILQVRVGHVDGWLVARQ
jgi:hypothetical protein